MYEGYLKALALMDKGVLLDNPFRSIRKGKHAIWGLIAKGSEAIPYALTLLKHPESEARSAGASILGSLGESDGVVDELLRRLQIENDQEAKDSLIFTLGQLENKKAIPFLAATIQEPETDDETRWLAMESLGEIVHKRFVQRADPMAAARNWLEKNGFSERSQ
jgi:HEAT repeat protein